MTRGDNENTIVADDDSEVAALQERFPGWWIWISDTGTWWASRRAQLTSAEQNAGRAMYLRAGSAAELADLLAEEDA